MLHWESFEIGTDATGFGKEYLFKAENENCENVIRVVEHRPDFVHDDDFVWHLRAILNAMIEEANQRGM